MSGITLSAGVRQNLQTLQSTADLLAQTNNRLATGNKVNSAVDNPQSYFTASGLNNRASDLSTLQDNMGLAVQTINAASTGIDAITKLVNQAKSTANQALNADYHSGNLTTSVVAKNYSGASAALTIKIGNNASTSITISSNITSAGALKAAISAVGISGLAITTSSAGSLTFTVASGENVTVGGAVATATGGALAGNTVLASTDGIDDRNTYVKQYNDLLTQIDQQAGDSSFNGVNLLQSGQSLSVVFNEKGTSKLDVSGVNLDSTGLGLSATSISSWSAKTGINSTISALDKATTTLRAQSTAFGNNLSVVQNRQTFTKSLIATLQTGASNLTLADSNEEAANLLALQTRQSLATSALSISNQANQSITKLF